MRAASPSPSSATANCPTAPNSTASSGRRRGVAANIDRLQRSKTLGADIFAYIFGVVAALILGGGMCLVMLVEGSLPALIGGIAIGVVGIALCCVNYPIRQKIAANKTKQMLPLIDESEEKLANLLEQGDGLLRADVI